MPARYSIAGGRDDIDEQLSKLGKQPEQPDDDADIYKYRRRFRVLKAVGLGAALAGLTWLVMAMVDGTTNPCQRVYDYYCKKDPAGLPCKTYASVLDESEHDTSADMRSNVRSQCQSRIERFKSEDGIDLK